MLSTLYFYEENAIYYRSPNFRDGWRFSFDTLSDHYLPTGYFIDNPSKYHSRCLDQLAYNVKESTDMVYHLAGLIHQRVPSVDWGFEEQLFIIEQSFRKATHIKAVYKQIGIKKRPIFYSESDMIDFEITVGQLISQIEPDVLLRQKVKRGMGNWFQRYA